MNGVTALKEVFAEFGRAAHQAQLIEYNLVSIWMIESMIQGVSVTRDDLLRFQQDWSTRTMGQLLRPLLKSGLIAAELKTFMEQVRVSCGNGLTRTTCRYHCPSQRRRDTLGLPGKDSSRCARAARVVAGTCGN
ncbi:MAG: hypothetical protein Q7T82_20090 [Armatimonadota bacterium]|nr:hypothetical protein [Armatimonadota bacterium]